VRATPFGFEFKLSTSTVLPRNPGA